MNYPGEKPLIFILDIMLAHELDVNAPYAIRNKEGGKKSLDYLLGIKFAKRIRAGEFSPVINPNTPILFFTARQDEEVIISINSIENSAYLLKGVFLEDIQSSLENLIESK